MLEGPRGLWGDCAATLVAVLVLGPLTPLRALSEAREEAVGVGEALCRSCHSVEAEHWDQTLHARVFRSPARRDLGSRTCEACHGPGSLHVADPSDRTAIVSFTRGSGATVERQNEVCLECHRSGPLLHWAGSRHEVQDLACSDCHNPMTQTSVRGLLRERDASRTCLPCHPEQRVEFRKRSHMPLFEGQISCTDCHAPHGSNTDPLLHGDSVNQLCTGCHAEKRGPFLWEHAPVRESCLNCHRPHGSNHERLLVTARPLLCQQCHSQASLDSHPSTLLSAGNLSGAVLPDERLINRSCTNCHAQIHGSNHPSGPRFHR